MRLPGGTALLALLLIPFHPWRPASADPDEADLKTYQAFNESCRQAFALSKESEIEQAFGNALKMNKEGFWSYVSETSAVLAWETSLPAQSYVEYGTTIAYGLRTVETERPFSIHVHYLRELVPNTEYHCRLVCATEGDRRLVGEDFTFTTPRLDDAIRIPGDLGEPPYVLDRANATYLVTQDITANSTAFNIAANGVTLDLGGHVVVYNEKAGSPDPSALERLYGWHAVQNPCGVRTADQRNGIRVLNGTLRQGRGNGASMPSGFNPLYLRRPRNAEVAGVTGIFSGAQVTGILVSNSYPGTQVHHNVLLDTGTALPNPHRGMDAIAFGVGKCVGLAARCHRNLIKRTRHRGITASANAEIAANEVFVDGCAVNSYGITYYTNLSAQGLLIQNNRIWGMGCHVSGIGSGQGWSEVRVSSNYIQMQGAARAEGGGTPVPDGSAGEPGVLERPSVNGLRLQRPGSDVEHAENVVVVKGSGGQVGLRGLWLVPDEETGSGVVFRRNRIKVVAEDDRTSGCAIVCSGVGPESLSALMTLAENTVTSNVGHVQFGDDSGHGGRYSFVGNTFHRLGADPRYRTIRVGWQGWRYETYGHLFVDTAFGGGAGFDSVSFDGASGIRYDFSVGSETLVQATPGTRVTVTDKKGSEVFAGRVPATGKLALNLVQYVCTPQGRTLLAPYTVTMESEGKTVTKEIPVDRMQEVDLRP